MCNLLLNIRMSFLLATALVLSINVCLCNSLTAEPRVSFTNDIMPILSKFSCDSGGCHGKANGQNGFRLSLFGGDPLDSYRSIVLQAKGRRVFPAAAEKSLLLRKATGATAHGGGRRMSETSESYQTLKLWIEQGLARPSDQDAVLERIQWSPRQVVLAPDAQQKISVRAFYSDGSSRDVTSMALFSMSVDGLAQVTTDGLLRVVSEGGLGSVTIKYGEQTGSMQLLVPYKQNAEQLRELQGILSSLKTGNSNNGVNEALVNQWQRLQIEPAKVCDDPTFIRRASIDICGTLPTASEVLAFVSDSDVNKRERLVDRLLEQPEYASHFAIKWADILQNRGRGYSTSKQRTGTTLFYNWIRDSLLDNKPYDQFVSEILTATGSQEINPPTVWYRSVRTMPNYVESVAQAFLGVRIQCAQCHHHPTAKWSQADYFGLAANFARVGRKGGFADAEVPTGETIYLLDHGEIRHPKTQQVLPPKPLGDPPFELDAFADPRVALAGWMTGSDNEYFADTLVNRLWAHFLGRGIIHPVDDRRDTNPPSNPELLQALSDSFVKNKYDLKQLIRLICGSSAYNLGTQINPSNQKDQQTFSRFYPRRMSAEVLLDAVSQTLEVPTAFPGGLGEFPLGTRAIELPDENVAIAFLDVFGRPARFKACECERIDTPTLAQGLELVNSNQIQSKLSSQTGFAHRLAVNNRSPQENCELIFLTLYGRAGTAAELEVAVAHVSGSAAADESDKIERYRNLIWALLASNEFMFVQ
jgi:hypothetical protein